MFGLEKIARKIEIPPPGIDADLAIPAFHDDSALIAERVKNLNNPLVGSVAVAGKYVNIKFNLEHLAPRVLGDIRAQGEQYGWNESGAGKTVLIEYSSPNIAKPMHIGHARNNAIGHALVNLHRAGGYKVITANYLGDWGMSFAKIMLAYQKWGDRAALERDSACHLLAMYIRMAQEAAAHPELEDEARALFKKLEGGDVELRALWQEFHETSVVNFRRVYALLGIDFDLWHGESFYEPFINGIIQEALDKGVATRAPDGPVMVDLKRHNLPVYLLRKSDGASLYGARDLAVAQWRLREYNPDLLLYVVGHEQELYLKQIFKTLGLMGYPEEKFAHISYGMVTLNGEKVSTRSGNIVFLEDVLRLAIEKSKGNEIVGIGAVVFNMLSQGREKDIAFTWDNALNLQGNSAPYVQYGYVRVKSILEKAGHEMRPRAQFTGTVLSSLGEGVKLLKMMAQYPSVVRGAQDLRAPHRIANFLNGFVQEFNRFYATVPVLSGDNDIQRARLALIQSVAQVIKNGLWLLGIGVPERM